MEVKLALGGGGARGVAHLGVLRALENHGFKICAISGTSAGGIVAALYAAGYTVDEMASAFDQIEFREFFRRGPEDGPSLFGLAGVSDLLARFLGERSFDDLDIPCALTGVDLYSGREVIISQGRVLDAVLATIALPGIFPPQSIGEDYLVDGGLLDPVPVVPVRGLASHQPILAVVLSSTHPKSDLMSPTIVKNLPFLHQIARLRVAQAFNIFIHSLEIGSISLSQMRLDKDKPDVIIRPDVEGIGLFDRVDVEDVIQRGESATREALPEIENSLKWTRKLNRFWNSSRRNNLFA